MITRSVRISRLLVVAISLITLSCNFVTKASNVATLTPAATINPPKTPIDDATVTIPPEPSPTSLVTPTTYVPLACQAVTPEVATAEPTPTPKLNPPLSSDIQLKVFDKLAGIIDEVYMYPDFNGLDWPEIVSRYRANIESGMDTETFYTEMEKFVIELGDEHSHFELPAQVALSNTALAGANNYVGIGVYIQPLLGKNQATILSVFPNSPAEYGGLKPHDSIIAVDDLPIVENGKVFTERVRGPECSTVVLTVQSPGETQRKLTLVRFRITSPLLIDTQLVPTNDGSRIGYIFLPTFFDETIPDQVKKALEDFGPLDGLILDNRMNRGGSGKVMEQILSYFTSGMLGQFVSRTESRPLNITANPVNTSQTVSLVVLVGQDTVSYGEVFSGVLQDSGRAKIVGQTTLGNVETLHSYSFEDGSQAWIAQEWFDPTQSHANWEQDGIQPDVESFANWDTFRFDNDPSVAAAVALLGYK